MRWKQFFTRIQSINTDAARRTITEKASEEITILDVRQPSEYKAGHIPGAKLIPLPDLTSRLGEIEPGKLTLVY